MRTLLIVALLCVFCNGISAQQLTPQTPISFNDGDYSRNLTGADLWNELNQFEAEKRLSTNVTVTKNSLGEEEVYIPLAPSVQKSLELQRNYFQASAIPLETTREGQDLDIGYNQMWGKQDSFAAYVDARVQLSGDKISRRFHSHFYAGGYVFNQDVKAIELDVNMQNGSVPTASASLKVFGQTKFSSTQTLIYNKIFYSNEFSKTVRFFIGPVPVSVTGAIGGSVGFEAKLGLVGVGIEGVITPGITSYGKADAGVDLWFAKAGVQGTIDLVIDHLPVTAAVQLINNFNTLQMTLNVQNNLRALFGKIIIFAKVLKFWEFWHEEWKYYSMELFSWQGIERSWTLLDKNYQVPL